MTPYQILGVPVSASADEIKLAYKRAAKREHPDKHPNDYLNATARFQEIAFAYHELSDPEKRAALDRSLANGAGSGSVFTPEYADERAAREDIGGVCSLCGGEGVVRIRNSIFWTREKCPKCKGK